MLKDLSWFQIRKISRKAQRFEDHIFFTDFHFKVNIKENVSLQLPSLKGGLTFLSQIRDLVLSTWNVMSFVLYGYTSITLEDFFH